MIVRAINQIVVHLQSFRNIQLYYQGLYFLKINVYQQTVNSKIIYAHPYAHTENYNPYQTEDNKGKFYDNQIIRAANIDDSTSSFFSKAFVIKFCQEQVELNDICHFRIENQICEDQQSKLYVQASLMFYDYMSAKNQVKDDRLIEQKLITDAKIVNVKKFIINNHHRGIHEYCPIIFDQHYFSHMSMMVHTICLDYKFRVSGIQLSEFSKLNQKQKLILLENNKKIDRKNISIYESMLKSMNLKNNSNSLQIIQNIIVKEFREIYENLYLHYNVISSRCIMEKQKKIFKHYLVPPSKLSLLADDKSLLKMSFYERIVTKFKSKDNQYIINCMLNETNSIATQLFQLWHKTLDLYKISPRLCTAFLQEHYMKRQKCLWRSTVVTKHRIHPDFSISYEINDSEKDKQTTDLRFSKKIQQNLFDINFFPKPELLPVIHQDIYFREKIQNEIDENDQIQDYRGIHLFVFVHGFQGNSYDMKMIKNYVSFLHPESLFLCASSNQQLTDGDIIQMGCRLATQVKQYINQHCPHGTLGRLSFIGHSLGGLKIRAALPLLSQFQDKMYTYISFSSPHLGFMYNTSSLIDAGIWLLNKMKNSLCLKQLAMSDAQNLQDTAIYKLAQFKGLKWFKHIYLFGSRQDSYSPYQSARIQICKDAYNDKKNGNLYVNMVRKLINQIQNNRLHRLDVNFSIQQRNIDSFIGRTAHIMFLQCQPLIRSVIFNFNKIFA